MAIKKLLLFSIQTLLVFCFILTLFFSILEFAGKSGPLERFNSSAPVFNDKEDFDPSLGKIDNVNKLEKHCDSIYEERKKSGEADIFEAEYARITGRVVRQKFYHGMSSYGFGRNYLAYLLNPDFVKDFYLNAPVIPNDILKYPYALCSQQALVAMKLLKKKGITTRKVAFYDKDISGHFCFEVFYKEDWHFFDTDIEPNTNVLREHNRPGIKFLVEHPDILVEAYNNKMEPEKAIALFSSYSYGKPNERLAVKAVIYQRVTKFLSYTIWIFFLLAFVWVRRKYLRLSNNHYVRDRRVSVSYL